MFQKYKQSNEPLLFKSTKFDLTQEFQAFNLDGREFITSKLKYHLIELMNFRRINEMHEIIDRSHFYALMNLPAMSIEFLDAFRSLYDTEEIEIIKKTFSTELLDRFRLNIYCYHFCKGDDVELEKMHDFIRKDIFFDAELKIESKYVRKVAPNKNMYCSMFRIGFTHFFMSNSTNSGIKHKLEETVEKFYEREAKIKKSE